MTTGVGAALGTAELGTAARLALVGASQAGAGLALGRRRDLAAVLDHGARRDVLERADLAALALLHDRGTGLEGRRAVAGRLLVAALLRRRVADRHGAAAVVDVGDVAVLDDRRVRPERAIGTADVRVVQLTAGVRADQQAVQDERLDRVDVAHQDAGADHGVDVPGHHGEHQIVLEAVVAVVVTHVAARVDDADGRVAARVLRDAGLVALVLHVLLELRSLGGVGLLEALLGGLAGARAGAGGHQAENQGGEDRGDQRADRVRTGTHESLQGIVVGGCCLAVDLVVTTRPIETMPQGIYLTVKLRQFGA